MEVLTMGRIGVDIYPLQVGVPLQKVETFGKYLGGSPSNVAVAAARYGRRSAVITRTGDDPFGEYLHDALRGFGVDDRFVTPVPKLPTPVTFCEIFPPDDFPLYFYRYPTAPDLQIRADELDLDAVRDGGRVLGDGHRPVARSPAARRRSPRCGPAASAGSRCSTWTTGRCSGPPARRPAPRCAEALPYVTVAVGNLDECDTAVGEREPARGRGGAARRRASSWPSSSRARRACSPPTARTSRSRCRRCRSTWSTGSAQATRSAARCATACSPAGSWSGRCGSATRPGPSSPRGWPAPTRCRPPTRSRRKLAGGRPCVRSSCSELIASPGAPPRRDRRGGGQPRARRRRCSASTASS